MRIFTGGRSCWTLFAAVPFLFGILISVARAQPAPVPPAPILTVERAVSIALQDNPGLGQISARANAAAALPGQKGALPDPAISFRAQNLPTNSFDLDQEPMTQMQFGLSQAFPFPGKLRLRERAARHDADATAAEVTEARLALVRDVRAGWWEAFYLDRAIESVARNQELLRGLVDIARTKYEVGQGLQQDVLLAEVELSKLLDQRIGLKSARRSAAARLNTLLDWPANQPVTLPTSAEPVFPTPPAETILFEMAESSRPMLIALQSRIAAARAMRKLAKRDYFPDFKVNATYGIREEDGMNRDRPNFLSVGLDVTVPLYAGRKQSNAVAQRSAELNSAQLAYADAAGRVGAQITDAAARFAEAREQTVLFEAGILPQARQTVEAMRSGYLVNKVDFLNLVSSQMTLYNYETRYWRVLSNANTALATLAAAAGKETFDE
ncbi:MAG: TolC family protein [Rhodospirillales bacterium]|nr:TolC family protein [Rhodospirillales bacterium]